MRKIWFLIAAAGGAGLLALAMLLVNIGFELAGSLPDIDACGFLAGDLAALGIFYPLCAALIAMRIAVGLRRRYPDCERAILRCGVRIGLGGSALYLGVGLAAALAAPHGERIPIAAWYVVAIYSALIVGAARGGAWLAIQRAPQPATGETGG